MKVEVLIWRALWATYRSMCKKYGSQIELQAEVGLILLWGFIGLKVEVEIMIWRTQWATYRSICKNMEVTVGFKWKLN